MKLVKKLRVGGKIHRRYDEPKTPYQRLMESGQLDAAAKKKLKCLYESLNPAELKRRIELNLTKLFQFHQERSVKPRRIPTGRMAPHLVRSFMTQPTSLWLVPLHSDPARSRQEKQTTQRGRRPVAG